MNKVVPSILVLAGVGLGFVFGYLAGSGEPLNRVSISPTVQSKLTREMVRSEIDDALRQHLVGWGSGSQAANSGGGQAVPAESAGRTPSLELPVKDLERAIADIHAAVAALGSKATPNMQGQLALARSGQYPQRKSVVRQFCRRWVDDERDDEIKRKELLFMSPLEVLQRFGEPNIIELEVGSVYWEYSHYTESDDGMTLGWDMSLYFTEGAVMDASCDFYDDDD